MTEALDTEATAGRRLLLGAAVVVLAMLLSGPALSVATSVLRIGSVPATRAFWFTAPGSLHQGVRPGTRISVAVHDASHPNTTLRWTATGATGGQLNGTVRLGSSGMGSFTVTTRSSPGTPRLSIHVQGVTQAISVRVRSR